MSDIYELSSGLVDELAEAVPTLSTYLGLPGNDDRWHDHSIAGVHELWDLQKSHRDKVAAISETGDSWADLAREVVLASIDDELRQFEHGEFLLDLDSLTCPVQEFREVFDHMDRSTAAAWGDIAARLGGLPVAVDQYVSRLEEARASGSVVARRQVIEAARQARYQSSGNSYYLSLPGSMAEEGVEGGPEERLEAGVADARAAMGSLADYLEHEYLPSAVDRDAVGEERYARLARRWLGADLDLRATYEWGWSEVARLRVRMEEVGAEILPGGSMPEILDLLQTDPGRAASSQEEFAALMLERLHVALTDLEGKHFDVPKEIRDLDVKMAPPGGALGAYYVQPSEDFTRVGTVWWSKGEKQHLPLFDEISTAYHEGFPGHHLQNGFQMVAGDRVSRYQKLLVWYPGTGEGWALYAEDLMEEWGYLEKPEYLFGKYASEMLRACRVAIDIGSHLELPIPSGQPFHPGEQWTYETGVEMLTDYAAQDPDISVSEMNRYLGWPGQAIAYKVGQQAIRDLRKESMDRLGAAFDGKVFHARVLEVGSTGLDVLRRHVRGG